MLRFNMFTEFNEKELVRYAGSVEANAEHPIAQGIVRSAGELMPVGNFKAMPGKGAAALFNEYATAPAQNIHYPW